MFYGTVYAAEKQWASPHPLGIPVPSFWRGRSPPSGYRCLSPRDCSGLGSKRMEGKKIWNSPLASPQGSEDPLPASEPEPKGFWRSLRPPQWPLWISSCAGSSPEPLRQGQWEDSTLWLLWCTSSSGVLSQPACYCLLSGGLQQLLRAFCPAARAASVGETGLCSFPRPGTHPVRQTWCQPVTCTRERGALASWPSQIAVSL